MVASGGWWQRAQLRRRLLRTSLLSTTQDRKMRGPWAERGQGRQGRVCTAWEGASSTPDRSRGHHPDLVHPTGASKRMRVPQTHEVLPTDTSDSMKDPYTHWVPPHTVGTVEWLRCPHTYCIPPVSALDIAKDPSVPSGCPTNRCGTLKVPRV